MFNIIGCAILRIVLFFVVLGIVLVLFAAIDYTVSASTTSAAMLAACAAATPSTVRSPGTNKIDEEGCPG